VNDMEPLALPLLKAAELIGISPNHAYLLAQKGELPTFRAGKKILVSVEALRKWMDKGNKKRDTL
jgi:excisionase family DNA binding protein